MKKIVWLGIALLVVFFTLGAGYSVWSSNLNIGGNLISATYPTIATDAASSVTYNSATLNGNLSDLGSASGVQVYFEYGTDSTFTTYNSTTLQTMTSTGSFSAGLTGLTLGTNYYFRAVAQGGVIGYGSAQNFTPQYNAATLYPTQDTYVYQGSPTSNYGNSTTMMVGVTRSGDYSSLVQFDLSPYLGKTIVSALLNLYASSNSGSTGVGSNRITASWSASTVTWNNQPGNSNPGQTVTVSSSGWESWDVTSDVQAYAGGASFYGWMMTFTGNGNNRTATFYTSNYSGTTYDPYLTITYHN